MNGSDVWAHIAFAFINCIVIATIAIMLLWKRNKSKWKKSPQRPSENKRKEQPSPARTVSQNNREEPASVDVSQPLYDDDDDDPKVTTLYFIGDEEYEEDSYPAYDVGDIIWRNGKRYIVTKSCQVWSDGEGREEGYSVSAVPYNENTEFIEDHEYDARILKTYLEPKDGSPYGITDFSAQDYGLGKAEGVTIVKYSGASASSLSIPDTIDGKIVLSIEDGVFRDTDFVEITIPDTVMRIGAMAFMNNRNLMRVKLPGSLRHITKRMFMNCSSLEELVIPDLVDSIAQEAFFECARLKRIVLPSNLKDVLPGAFTGCNNLRTVEIKEETYRNLRDRGKENLPPSALLFS